MVYARPQHLQTQSGVGRANKDIELVRCTWWNLTRRQNDLKVQNFSEVQRVSLSNKS